MGKVVICLVLTLVFSFLSVQSFLSNDYARLQRWLAYYQEYKAFEEAVKRGNASKAELFERLKTMYPGQASELEAHLKEKYGDLTDTAKDTQSTLSDTLNDTLETFSSSRADVDALKRKPKAGFPLRPKMPNRPFPSRSVPPPATAARIRNQNALPMPKSRGALSRTQ